MGKKKVGVHDNWGTPKSILGPLHAEFNFNCDPCPLHCDLAKWDGLTGVWGTRNYINPPYSRMVKEAFVKKAIAEADGGKLCVMLLPVSTSTNIFHYHIMPNIVEPIRYLYKRIKFDGVICDGKMSTTSGQIDSMIVVFDGSRPKLHPDYDPVKHRSQPPRWY